MFITQKILQSPAPTWLTRLLKKSLQRYLEEITGSLVSCLFKFHQRQPQTKGYREINSYASDNSALCYLITLLSIQKLQLALLCFYSSLFYTVPQKITLPHNLHFKSLSNCFLTSFAQNLVFKQADLLYLILVLAVNSLKLVYSDIA